MLTLIDMNVRLSLEDLKKFGRDEDAVALPDGSGYAGTLNIYHEIHCVVGQAQASQGRTVLIGSLLHQKWMHVYMYQEHYSPGLDDAQRETNNKQHRRQMSPKLRRK